MRKIPVPTAESPRFGYDYGKEKKKNQQKEK